MVRLRVGCINVRERLSIWKQDHLLDDLISLAKDVTAVSKSTSADAHVLDPIFDNFVRYTSLSDTVIRGRVAKLCRKTLNLEVQTSCLDQGRNVLILYIYKSKRDISKLNFE